MKTEILVRLIHVNCLAHDTDVEKHSIDWDDEWVQHFARLIIDATKKEVAKELTSD